MSANNNPNGQGDASIPDGGILAALPRSRPQRESPRRAAARAGRPATAKSPSVNEASVAKPSVDKPPVARSAKRAATIKKPVTKKTTGAAEPPAPRQGYEPEEEFELGSTVNPPSGVELVESVADIVGELANSGLAASGRLLKDAFSLLRRS
jgi:hypothetical protein